MYHDFKLTEDQAEAFENIKIWLDTSDDQFYTLSGYAGSGKTVLMDYIVDYATDKSKPYNERFKTIVTATTNKAVKVLNDLVDHKTFSTIHKLLNIKPKRKGTKEIFEPISWNKSDINEYDLVLIDECSMISEKLLDIIKSHANEDVKILFVGDPAQLQPINESISKCFDYDGDMLTEIVRHDDTLAKQSKKLRNNTEWVNFETLISPPDVEWITLDEIKEVFVGFRDNPDKYRMLCWTNRAVKEWNKKLRVFDYEYIPNDHFKVGDVVIANQPCEVNNEIVMRNSEEAVVDDVNYAEDDLGIRHYVLRVKRVNDLVAYLNVPIKEHEEKLSKKLNNLAKKCREGDENWGKFWYHKKYFHDVRHCYSLTTHKAQGSSFNNVIININDYNLNEDAEERNQLAYVGVTRAIDKVYLYKG